MPGRPSIYKNDIIAKKAAKKDSIKRYREKKNATETQKIADLEKYENENIKLKNECASFEKDFNRLLPKLCKHDKMTATKLWNSLLSNPNFVISNEDLKICGCNETEIEPSNNKL